MPGSPKIEGRLQRELSIGKSRPDELLDVVVKFELPPVGASAARQPITERREAIARTMSQRIENAISRTSSAVGEEPTKVSVFPALGSVLVQASRPFVKVLVEQADVRGAVLNAGPTDDSRP